MRAFYESDITSLLRCYLNGYGADRRVEDVYNRLNSKALVIEQNGEYAVIIAVDICEYPEAGEILFAKMMSMARGLKTDSVFQA